MLGSLINAVGDSVKAAHDTDNDRLQGAYALKAGYDAYKVKKTLTDVENSAADQAAAGIPEPPPVAPDGTPRDNSGAVIGVQVYVGSSRSKPCKTKAAMRARGFVRPLGHAADQDRHRIGIGARTAQSDGIYSSQRTNGELGSA